MRYVFQFGVVADHWPALVAGALATLRLSLLAMAFGLAIAILCAFLRRGAPRPIALAVATYVEIIRNTPLLVQLFIIYFSLPGLGIRLEAEKAAVLGLSLNLGGYASEILRAGLDAIPRAKSRRGGRWGLPGCRSSA